MFYWLTAISIKLFGVVEWALRLAPALGATLIAFAGFRLLARWMGHRIALTYLLVLGTMPIMYGGAQYANHDMLVAGFIGSPRMNFMPIQSVPGLAVRLPQATVQVGVRPEHWVPCAAGEGVALTVKGSEYLGAQRLVHALLADGTKVELLLDGEGALSEGQVLHMRAQDHHVHAFDAKEQRLERAAA